MFKNLRQNTVAAAGLAALLLTGACASHRTATDSTVTETTTVTQSPLGTSETAAVDSNGNVVTTADGVTVTEVTNAPMTSSSSDPTLTTTTTTVTTNAPMTSSTQEATEEPTTPRTRLRKD